MQTEKKIYIALAVLAALGGGLYLQAQSSKKHMAAHEGAAVVADLPKIKMSDDDIKKVTKITLKNKDDKQIVLEKRKDKWWVTKPLEAIGNQDNVKSLLDNLKALEVNDSINDTPEAPKMYKEYDLEGDKALHVVVYKGKDKALDLTFGKNGSRGQIMSLAGKPGIWLVKGYSSFQYARKVKDWRDKKIQKFEDKNATSVTIENENGKFSFSKDGDKWTGTFDGKAIERFDPNKVKDLLRAYRSLQAEDFADGKKDQEMGLDKPTGKVTVVLKDNATYTMLFGKTSTGSSHFARREGTKGNFIVGSWASDWATAKVDKFQKPDGKKKGDKDKKPKAMTK